MTEKDVEDVERILNGFIEPSDLLIINEPHQTLGVH